MVGSTGHIVSSGSAIWLPEWIEIVTEYYPFTCCSCMYTSLPCLQIRAATFSLVATAYKQLPEFIGTQAGLLCPLVLGSLGESDPVVVGPLWEAILLTVTTSEVLVAVEGV